MTDLNYTDYDDNERADISKDELQRLNQQELIRYERTVPMTPAEKRALRGWVSSGHSVQEHPGSGYLCLYGAWPPPDFLSVYRMDREIRRALKGKTWAEQEAYLKEYVGYEEYSAAEKEECIVKEQTPATIKNYIRKLERELFYIGLFLSQEGLYEEAHAYVEDHKDEPIPFEFG